MTEPAWCDASAVRSAAGAKLPSAPCTDAAMDADQALIAEALGTPPLAHVFLSQLDVHACYWHARVKQVSLRPLSNPLLAVRVAGVARMSWRHAQNDIGYRSTRGTLELLPQATAAAWTFVSGEVNHITLGIGQRAAATHHLAGVVNAFEVIDPEPLIRELTLAMVDAMTDDTTARDDNLLIAMTETLLYRAVAQQLLATRQRVWRLAQASCVELTHLIERLPKRCGENLSVSALARESGMCVTTFNERFKAATGVSPHQFLTQLRLKHVCAALRATDEPLACIALSAGFSSQSHLTAVFHKSIGLTPQQYRARRALAEVAAGGEHAATRHDDF